MENYDIQTIQDMLGQSAKTAMQTAATVANLSDQMGMITTRVNTQEIELCKVKTRLDTLEYKSEISGAMCTNIKSAAAKRLIDILGEEDFKSQKYNSLFFARIYADARKYAGLCKPISMTQRGDYQRVINYIEAWTPMCGIKILKADALERARKRLVDKAFLIERSR
mgnify:CR=1 FL=1|jgi:hypothetical protein